jgi:excisionase family DNA binding protein
VVAVWRQDRQRAGRRLRALREAAALTQLQVAAASGLSHEAISRLETGHYAASGETVLQLAHALRVKPEQFIRREPVGLTMLTVVEAASRLHVPARRVQTWLREGVLPGVKISGQWRVPMVVVVELIRSERLRGRSRRLDPRFRG